MNSTLCIGIASTADALEIAAREGGQPPLVMRFPPTAMGLAAIQVFLASYESSMRLAVAGVAALSLALALGNVPGREAFIIASGVVGPAVALAHYAEITA